MAYTRLNPASENPTQAQLGISISNRNGYTVTLENFNVYGKVVHATIKIKPSSNVTRADYTYNPCQITGFRACLNTIVGDHFHGTLNSIGNVWIYPDTNLTANSTYEGALAALLP